MTDDKNDIAGAIEKAANADVMNVREACKMLRIGSDTLYALCGDGTVPHRRLGRSYRFSRRALLAWLGGTVQVAQKG